MGNYYDELGIYHEISEKEMNYNPYPYKGSSTKRGGSHKEVAKRRKRNKNKKTHR